jgi:N-acetylglutamate synthase-like GNAT family acetyltransferase
LLNPECDPARIRAFFIHPDWARRGIGRCILVACESAIQAAGFHSIQLVATPAGEPFYAAFDDSATDRYEIAIPGDLTLSVVRMTKYFGA